MRIFIDAIKKLETEYLQKRAGAAFREYEEIRTRLIQEEKNIELSLREKNAAALIRARKKTHE